jgi:hypothetical protein
MSELRVALVAEGPTDFILIEAALKALLPMPFLATLLQPEPIRPRLGEGWGGVLRWCLDFASCGYPRIEDDPRLPGFDLFVIHLDADVSESTYRALGQEIETIAAERRWPTLPCSLPCPPPENSANALRIRVLAWAGITQQGPRTVLCMPSKSTDAWLAAAVLVDEHRMLDGLECNSKIGAQLGTLPKAERIRKSQRRYREHAQQVAASWNVVRQRCSLAERFSSDIAAITS